MPTPREINDAMEPGTANNPAGQLIDRLLDITPPERDEEADAETDTLDEGFNTALETMRRTILDFVRDQQQPGMPIWIRKN